MDKKGEFYKLQTLQAARGSKRKGEK